MKNSTVFKLFKFYQNCFLLLAPLLAWSIIELCLLPMDAFSFRMWEVSRPRDLRSILRGSFYPGIRGHFEEQGDLAFHSPDAVIKHTEWETDRYGFRNHPSQLERPIDVVVVGDSESAGSGLSQSEMLASQLMKLRPDLNVYTYALGTVPQFLSDPRFQAPTRKPKLVIFPQIERNLNRLEIVPLGQLTQRGYSFTAGPHSIHLSSSFAENPKVQAVIIFLDRLMNLPSYHWLQARISGAKTGPEKYPQLNGNYFYEGAQAMKGGEQGELADVSNRLLAYQQALGNEGIHFLFFAIPNKETFFHSHWSKKPPETIHQITQQNAEKHIDQIDLSKVYLQKKSEVPGFLPYHTDDSHWNSMGTETAALEVVKHLQAEGKLPPP